MSAEKCEKRDFYMGFLKSILIQNMLKNEVGTFWRNQFIFEKKYQNARKIYKHHDNQSGDPKKVFEGLDVGLVLDEVLSFPICFGHP